MPKAKGTLYVGYTSYPNLPKTQEGYLRQGKDVEDDFILFKRGLVETSTQVEEEVVVPEVLYFMVPDASIKQTLTYGVKAPEDKYLLFFKDTKTIEHLLDTNPQKLEGTSMILKIGTKQMVEDGYEILNDKEGNWVSKEIPSQYISVLK